MSVKKELLSIGEMAKYTNVGIQALRYYERKNILKPAFIDPDTGYRYYSIEQATSIDIISVCVELDIPLKELVSLFNTENFEVLQEFFARNKRVAENKLIAINTMLILADKAINRMNFNKHYELGQIYTREIPEKIYYIKSCGKSLENANHTKMLIDFAEETKANLANYFNAENINESMVLVEYGFLRKHSPTESQYFTFAEVPKILESEKTITIPTKTYHFRKDKCSNIENATDIFKQHIENIENYFFIEVEEMISGKAKINEPIYELRLVVL
jgi:DNA-binding transcriptional MerR regulator